MTVLNGDLVLGVCTFAYGPRNAWVMGRLFSWRVAESEPFAWASMADGTTILPMRLARRNIVSVCSKASPGLAVLMLMVGVGASACVSQSIVVVGETPLPPASDIPFVTISVIDDEGIAVSGASVRVSADDQETVSDEMGLATIPMAWQGGFGLHRSAWFLPWRVRI